MVIHGVGTRMLTEARSRETLASLITDDHLAIEFTLAGERFEGKDEAWEREFTKWLTAFPDLDIQVTNAVSTDTIEFVEGVATGTHTGAGPFEVGGKRIEPTGRTIEIRFCSVYEIRDGKASKTRHYWDDGLIMQQLGILDLETALSA